MNEGDPSSDSASERQPAGEASSRVDLRKEVALLSAVDSQQVSGHHAKTLLKHSDFTVVLVTLSAGASLPKHQTTQRVCIHVLSGSVQLRLPSEVVDLPADHLLALEPAIPHDVQAIEDSSMLLTIARPHQPRGAS